MGNKGTNLITNQYLGVNDYLVSSNGVFVALMQSDGNLVVYRGQNAVGKAPTQEQGSLWQSGSSGSGGVFVAIVQSDGNFVVYPGLDAIGKAPTQEQGSLWSSRSSGSGGQFFVVLNDDGNLTINSGTPSTPGNSIWQSGATDPVVGYATITSVVYDLPTAVVTNSPPTALLTVPLVNDTPQPQPYTVNRTVTVTQVSGWSDSLGLQIGARSDFKAQYPFLVEGKVELSLSITNTFTWNSSTSTTQSWNVTAGPVQVPAGQTIIATISATSSSISVPYTLTGILTLQSGAQVSGQIQGTYNGVNCWNCTVELSVGQPNSSPVKLPTTVTVSND
jgi:hypothetical protein